MTISTLHARALRERRGIDPALAASLGVRSEGNNIGFEYRRHGQVHNVKVRAPDKAMWWLERNKPLIAYNIDSLAAPPAPDEMLIITEGEFDAIAVAQAGFPRVISVPGGAPATTGERSDKRYGWLYQGRALHPDIAKFETVILAVDGDEKGRYLRDDLAVRIGDEKCWWVEWPEGCKDANDVLRAHGETALSNCIMTARRMWLDFVCRMSDIADPPPERLYTFGLAALDGPIEDGGMRLPSAGFVTAVGPKGCGKSVFIRQLLWHLWREHGAPFAITALEEPAKPRYLRDFRRYAIGRPIAEWTEEDVAEADREIDQAMVIIRRPPLNLLNQDEALAAIEYAIKVYGAKVACIDPVNDIDHEYDEQQHEYLRKFIMRCKGIADRYRVLFICVVHPPSAKAVKKRDALWTLYDAEGSASWAHKSDVGLCFWQPDAPRGATLLHVDKLKDHETSGRPDLLQLAHDANLNRFVVARRGYDILATIAADQVAGMNGRG